MLNSMIDSLDDEQAEAVFMILKLMFRQKSESTLEQSQKAFETIERLRKPFATIDTDDYRALYREEMERKYQDLD